MPELKEVARLLAAAACLTLAACGSAEPVAYGGIASSPHLRPNAQDSTGRIPYRYATDVDWRLYSRVIIDPVTIYRGPDNQFGDMSDADRAMLAGYMQAQFSEKMRRRFQLAMDPAPNTLRVRLTLTGAATTTPILGTLSRFDIAGGLYNGVQSIRGGEGVLTGSVIYAVELYDAPTSRLLGAYATKQYPNSMNIGASLGSLDAARTGIEKGADALVAQLR